MRMNQLLLAGALCASSGYGALAEPIIYKFTVGGPGDPAGYTASLDGVAIGGGDDVMTFTFTADTSTVQTFLLPNASGFFNPVGIGTFSIVDEDTMEVVEKGTFLPSAQHFCECRQREWRGRLRFEFHCRCRFPRQRGLSAWHRILDCDNVYRLPDPIGVFGRASVSCPGFPGACTPPTALATTLGDLVIGGTSTEGGTFVEEFTTGGEAARRPPAPVPEPSTWAMMVLGFAGLGYAGWRKARPAAVNA